MQRTHGFSGNRLTRALRAGAIALSAGAIFALAMLQPKHGGAQDFVISEPFISGIWEHKVEVSVVFPSPANLEETAQLALATGLAGGWHAVWEDGTHPEIGEAQAKANETAIWACDFYKREAIGPLYEEAVDALRRVLTYACALP